MKLQPDGVIAEPATRQPRPFDRVLAFLDALLRFAPLIVEQCHPLGRSRQVGDDEPDPGKQLAGVPLHLGDDAAGLIPAFGPIAEAGVMAPHMVRRTANGSREQMADAFQKNLVLRQTDRVQEALVFQETYRCQVRRKPHRPGNTDANPFPCSVPLPAQAPCASHRRCERCRDAGRTVPNRRAG